MDNLSYRDYLLMPELIKLAQFAEKAEKAIKAHYDSGFGIGKTEINVWSRSELGEYYCDATLTNTGLWKFHDNWWGGRDYEVMCDGENIFAHLTNQLLLHEKGEDDNTMDSALREFKSWVKSLPEWEPKKEED